MATVLEDCVDQLAILGRIMPASYEEKPDADEVSSSVQFKLTCSCSRSRSKTKRTKSHRLFQAIFLTSFQNDILCEPTHVKGFLKLYPQLILCIKYNLITQ